MKSEANDQEIDKKLLDELSFWKNKTDEDCISMASDENGVRQQLTEYYPKL